MWNSNKKKRDFSVNLIRLTFQKLEPPTVKESQPVHSVERRHPSSSFVDSIMVALTTEKEEDGDTETPPEPGTAAHMHVLLSPKCNSCKTTKFCSRLLIAAGSLLVGDKYKTFYKLCFVRTLYFSCTSSQSVAQEIWWENFSIFRQVYLDIITGFYSWPVSLNFG